MKKNSIFKQEKQKPSYIFFALLTFIFLFIESCKKEPVQQNNLGLTSNTRLSLSQQNFEDIYLKLRKTSNKEQVKEFIALKNSKPSFISLRVSNLDSKISETSKRSYEKHQIKNKLKNLLPLKIQSLALFLFAYQI